MNAKKFREIMVYAKKYGHSDCDAMEKISVRLNVSFFVAAGIWYDYVVPRNTNHNSWFKFISGDYNQYRTWIKIYGKQSYIFVDRKDIPLFSY